MNKQTGMTPILIILLIALAIGGYLVYSGKITLPQKQIACTMDAKVCPDGTSVGRSGPKCEFAACPAIQTDEINNWKTYVDKDGWFSIKYPSDWEVNLNQMGYLDGFRSPDLKYDDLAGGILHGEIIYVVYNLNYEPVARKQQTQEGSLIETSKVTLNNREATRGIGEYVSRTLSYYVIDQNHEYDLGCSYSRKINTPEICETIIQTFKILK